MGRRTRRGAWALALGLLLVGVIAAGAAYAGWTLYTGYAWQSTARASAEAVAAAIQAASTADDAPPAVTDATAAPPGPGQVAIADLPYAADVPSDVERIRIAPGGALSVLTADQALCAGVTLDLETAGQAPRGAFFCGDALPPPAPVSLSAQPRNEGVILEWPHPPAPVEDYRVEWSADGGATWTEADDGVSAVSRATVQPLRNGREYGFRVSAVNLAGTSAPVATTAIPFTEPSAPTAVQATGGFSAVVSWQPPADDGGRPLSGYLVVGEPAGECSVPAGQTRCELDDLPAAPEYRFTVRAVNEAGAGPPSSPATDPIAIYSEPGAPVALAAAPGDRQVLLRWTAPLRDGNTPITDYRVQYRRTGSDEWVTVERAPSTDTVAVVTGLVNGVSYEFAVLAVNRVGTSPLPLTLAVESPATVPGPIAAVEVTPGDSSAALAWTPPALDGDSPVTGYALAYRAGSGPWEELPVQEGTAVAADVGDLVNGTPYAFRVAAVNRMGRGPWSPRGLGTPVGPPGPVVDPESVGSLTAIELSWQPPENDGGRPLRGYLVDYRPVPASEWIRAARVPADRTTWVLDDVEPGAAYDIRIAAVSAAGVGPATPDGLDRPTLAAVIADETPAAPEGLVAIPGDGQVTLRWDPVPAGRRSPITAYTVTGTPEGTCTSTRTTCVVRGLANGRAHAFTVTASNASITGPASDPVTATPRVFNEATGGTVTTYTRGGRTFRVHTFASGGTFTVTRAGLPFSVLVVGGGGGSAVAPDGSIAVGGGGGIIDARQVTLPVGSLAVMVGAGGPAGSPGGVSALDAVGAAPAGVAGAPGAAEFSPTTLSRITGLPTTYGGAGTPTSGPGPDGLGVGGGGPSANRGGDGVVVIRYEVARPS